MKKLILVLTALTFLSGCGTTKKVTKKPKKKLTRVQELHRKAKFSEAAGIVGYDGKAIHKQLDKVIDLREKETKDLNDALNKVH